MSALAINPAVADPAAVAAAIARTGAILHGHFALRRELHIDTAVRFRAIGRDPDALALIAAQLAGLASWSWDRVRVLAPESAGFFLGAAVARLRGVPHAVVETDARRLPTGTLATGEIAAGDRVVLVNDVGSTGAGFEPMLELIAERGARAIGVLLFTVVGADAFAAWCARRGLVGHHLTVARWGELPPGAATCAGCAAALPLVPVTEFS
jgi:adenine/guanine phosphoribosyltransferase-like PRPP-binding protein